MVVFIIVAGKIGYSSFMNSLSESIADSQAIGITGGADGPTAIFISGSFDLKTTVVLLFLSLLLVGGLFVLNIAYLKKLGKS